MQTSTAFASSPTDESFAAFLAKLAEQPASEATHEPDDVLEIGEPADEVAALSYEHALRAPVKKQVESVPLSAPDAAPATGKTTISLVATEKRKIRTSICLAPWENALLRQRAEENSLSISAYVRACIFEVEALRAQVKQRMAQVHATSVTMEFPPPKPAIEAAAEQPVPIQPVFDAPKKQSALPEPAPEPVQQRPRVPLTAREPQPKPATMTEAGMRLRAAIEAQKQLSQRERRTPAPAKKTRGLLGSIFGARRSA